MLVYFFNNFLFIIYLLLQFLSVFFKGRITCYTIKSLNSKLEKKILFIYISFDFAQSFIKSVFITRFLVSKFSLKFLGIFFNIVIVVANRKSFNNIVPSALISIYTLFVSAFPCLLILLVSGSRVSPAILDPKIFPFIDLGLPDLMTQLRFNASLTKA